MGATPWLFRPSPGTVAHLIDHVPSGFVVLRTPLLPFDELESWSEGLEAPEAVAGLDRGRLETAVTGDRARLRRRLLERFQRPELNEALFVASPSLHRAVEGWSQTPEREPQERTERALVAYFSRACARPTPFGLFAGCSVGVAGGGKTTLALADRRAYRRHTRLDMDYLWALADVGERDPELRRALVFRPNSSLYRVGGQLRYAEALMRDNVRVYRLVAAEATPYLLETLERARQGARLGDLAGALVDDEVTEAEAAAFVAELVDGQILRPDIYPQLTGPEPIYPLVVELEQHPATRAIAARLKEAQTTLERIDERGLGEPPERYRSIATSLRALPATPDESRLFQVDLIKPAPEARVGEAVCREALRAVDLLQRVAPDSEPDSLAEFRRAFAERYETREVPLIEALDEESGIGFERSPLPSAEASPLLEGVAFPTQPEPRPWTPRDSYLLHRLTDVIRRGEPELRLEARDLDEMGVGMRPERAPLPQAFSVTVRVAAASEADLAAGGFRILLQGASGPSGAELLGRFCHVDPELHARVADHLRTEQEAHPDRILAEIVHLPQGRVGNILCRPVLRAYEIPYLGRSGAPPERQIPVTDLLVSVRNGRVVLRSASLGREVVPRLTTAHNVDRRSLGLYRFLSRLRYQGVAGSLRWSWGPLAGSAFLPRVASGRAVLSRARWNLGEQDLEAIRRPPSPAERFSAVRALRDRWGLPRHVALAERDNELVTDLDNVVSVETLLSRLKDRRAAALVELFPGPRELLARGPEGRFVHELVIPFVRTPSPTRSEGGVRPPAGRQAGEGAGAASRSTRPVSVARRFPPGSEWAYAKLYTGTSTADQVLREAVAPVVGRALESGAADRWFFIRYRDPEWHLRVRFHGDPRRLSDEVLADLRAAVGPLIEDGRVWRVQIDTYEREVERYGGGEGIELAERIFCADSDAVLGIVRLLQGDQGLDARWRLTLCGVAMLLADLGFDLEMKRAWARAVRDDFARELRAESAFWRQIAERQRRERGELEALIDPERATEGPLAPGVEWLRRRSRRLAPLVAELSELDRGGHLSRDLPDLAASYAHMHANRLLRSAHRPQELVIYHLLERMLTSLAARQTANQR
jgi:thiopeptide-type bacteriocin biosynthesis protein